MSRNWTRSPYGCPKCGGHTEGDSGPDHQLGLRCESCDWWKVYELGLEPGPSKELEEYNI